MSRRPGERSFFLCRDLQQPVFAFFGQKRRLVLVFPAVQRVSHHSHNAPAAPRRPEEHSFFFAGTCSSRSLRFNPKAPHGPAFCTSDASPRALRRRAYGFAVKRGPLPGTQRKRAPAIWQGPLKMGKEKAGTYLFSQVVSNQVSSALRSLTSVFGMGTGGTSA